jgi:hypothetical protein
MENRNIFVSTAVLVVGLAFSMAILKGADFVADAIRLQNFKADFPSNPALKSVVPLSNDRFAVVNGDSIAVYQVDAKGQVNRLSDVNTYYKTLMPNGRPDSSVPVARPE